MTQEALDEKMDNIRGAVTMGEESYQHPLALGTPYRLPLSLTCPRAI